MWDDELPAARWQAWWHARPSDTDVLVAARRQGFVVGAAELRDLGISRSATRTALRRGRWWSPAIGTVCPLNLAADTDDEHLVLRRRHAVMSSAAVLKRPDHIVAARSAAIVHGLPTLFVPDRAELAAVNHNGLGRRNPAHSYGAALYAYSVAAWHGVLVTAVARTLVDLARHDRRDAIMAADAALREELVTRAQIECELPDAIGWPGVRQAREVLALADPRAESPLESITRLALHDDGFPVPKLQRWIGGDRVDFYWPDHRFVLEADGRAKYRDDANWDEKKREQRLRGYPDQVRDVDRVIWSDVTRNWPATSARLRPYFRR